MQRSQTSSVIDGDVGRDAAEVIVSCLRRSVGVDAPVPVVGAELAMNVFQVGRLNKVANVVGKFIRESNPDLSAAYYEDYRLRTIALNNTVLRETIALARVLEAAHLPHVFLKGPLQQIRLHGTPFFKPTGDVDVFVPRRKFDPVLELLRQRGYEPEDDSVWWRDFLGELHLVRADGVCKVDLHHRVQQPGVPSPRRQADFLADVETMRVSDVDIPVLTDVRMALLISISIAKSFFGRQACADYVYDFHVLTSSLDAACRQELLAEARRQGLFGSLLLATRASTALTGRPSSLVLDSEILPELSDGTLVDIVVSPWRNDLMWPSRRRMLMALCTGRMRSFLPEAAWAAAGEMVRRVTDKPRSEQSIPGPQPRAAALPDKAKAAPKQSADVTVIIAAHNASKTIARAVKSALAEPEVAEVIVVDDASTDSTLAVVEALGIASGRLKTLRLDLNRGPSFARNRALEMSRSDFVSILDADDVVLSGRYSRMFAATDWDLLADNIIFVEEGGFLGDVVRTPPPGDEEVVLDLTRFVAGNISRRGVHRGELGFLKPVIRRAFLDENGLRYDEALRLGEDYDLYTRALAAGARFKIRRSCGYAAIVYPNSLSSRHDTQDLQRLADVDRALLDRLPANHLARSAIGRHERQTRDKYRLREFLDRKSASNLQGLYYALAEPETFRAVVSGVVADKVGNLVANARRWTGKPDETTLPRYLIPLPAEGSS